MFKKKFLITAIATMLIGIAAYSFLMPTIFAWYIKGYCRSCLKGELFYDSLQQENGKWTLHHPRFVTISDLESGGYRFNADKAVVDVSVSWLDRNLEFAISMIKPHFDVGEGARELKNVFLFPNRQFSFFNVYTSFSVPQGTLLVHELSYNNLVSPLYFSVNLACRDSKEGCLRLWFDELTKRGDSNHLEMALSEPDSSSSQLYIKANDFNCSSLMPTLKKLWPAWLTCEIPQGNINGEATITLPNHSAIYATGNFTINDIEIKHPLYEVTCRIPELTLSFNPEENKGSIHDTTQTTGFLSIQKNGSLHLYKNGNPFWFFNDIGGEIAFHSSDVTKLVMDATTSHHDKEQQLHVVGQLYPDQDQVNATLNFILSDNQSDASTKAFFAIRQLGERWSSVQAQLSRFTQEEFDFIKNICGRLYPSWQKINVQNGMIDVSMLAYLHGLYISEVNIEKISAQDIDVSIEPWNMSLSAPSASGSLSFDLNSQEIVPTINGELKFEGGTCCLEGFDQTQCQFSDLHANLSIQKGVIQKSLIKGQFAGLKGEAELDGTVSGEIIKCNFDGKVKDVLALLPRSIKEGVESNFADDHLKIIAGLTTHEGETFVKGKVLVSDTNEKSNELDFGFAVEKTSKSQFGGWPPDPIVMQYCSGLHIEVVKSVLPHIALPMKLAHDYWVKHKLGLAGFIVKDGWFEMHHLPLEKYLSPFIFQQNQIQLAGFGDFRGTFDEKNISVHYDAQDLTLENEDFSIEIKSISNAPEHSEKRYIGTHVFDLERMQSFGSLPVTNGTYFEKNTGLLFTDINACISIEDNKAHLSNVETFCNGIFFAGNIDIDWSMPGEGVFDVDILSHDMQGKVSQIQHLFSHFDKSLFFLKLPIEGNIAFRKNGGHLHFSFQPQDYTLQTTFEGILSDGVLSCDTGDVVLQELSLNIDYDHKASTLDFSDIQGAILVGKPGHVEEYALAGDYIRFSDYARDEASFDLWVGDRKRDYMRLAGRTVPNQSKDSTGSLDIILDQSLSHFGDAYPSNFQLTLKEWSQVENFHMQFNFHLKSLLSDLQRFSRTGFFFLSRSLFKELNEMKSAKGSFDVDLAYDGNMATFTYSIIGKEVALAPHQFQNLHLNGKKKGSTWTIDQLQLDEISLAADILKEDDVWNINFMGARFGKSLLLGLEGQYREDVGVLEAKINLLEADLAYLDEWPIMKQAIDEYHPMGKIKATGKMFMEFDKSMSNGVRLDLLMNGSLRSGCIKGFALQDFQNADLHYNSEKGWSIESVKTGLLSAQDGTVLSDLTLSHLNCDFRKDEIITDGLSFNVPVENLGWLAENLQQRFPNTISESFADTIRHLKKQGVVNGKLKVEFSGPHCALNLALEDGTYQFLKKDHDLKNFTLDYDPFELKISSQYRHLRQYFWMNVRVANPSLNSGELILSDYPLEFYAGQDSYPLTINWQVDSSHGFTMNKLEGVLCGIRMDLVRDPNHPIADDRMFLVGEVHANMEKAKLLLNDQLADGCSEWQVGKGYSLKGIWVIEKTNKPLTECLSFQGELLGRDFEFGGYQFYNMNAQVDYTARQLRGNHISITDPCGNLQVNELTVTSLPRDLWGISIPTIAMQGFRPSLLHMNNTNPPTMSKALVIRQLDIKEFHGIFGERNSYEGKGRLCFVNPPKKNLQHTIFAIPSELMTRLGLDLAALTPVRGLINYEIKDGKIHFIRFKDVYSKGRLSKFYLSNNGTPSYLDFDGNLNVQVRMKQYNLFFKIAELFTVTVQGTIKKPSYSLHKQPKADRASAIKNLIKR